MQLISGPVNYTSHKLPACNGPMCRWNLAGNAIFLEDHIQNFAGDLEVTPGKYLFTD